jgi:hypothetical protein
VGSYRCVPLSPPNVIWLAVACVVLYILGGMLAYHMCMMSVEMGRPTFRDPAARIAVSIIWPSLAIWLTFDRYEDEDDANPL